MVQVVRNRPWGHGGRSAWFGVGKQQPQQQQGKPHARWNAMKILLWIVSVLALGYGLLLIKVIRYHSSSSTTTSTGSKINNNLNSVRNMASNNNNNNNNQNVKMMKNVTSLISINDKKKKDWKQMAVDMAALPPGEILRILNQEDPFGVRTFETKLMDMESEHQAILTMDDIKTKLFPCPTQRITLPDRRELQRARTFRQGLQNLHPTKEQFVFLFFQHLRKAGGTNFCALAERNLVKKQVPKYYCMPDMYWDGKKCAGCFLSYTNEEIETKMLEAGHLILGNEWDPFDERFLELPAIFATSFRKPLDRALSQFRFECIEERGCKIKNVTQWWEKRKDLTNVYTWTFAHAPVRRITIGKTKKDAAARQEVMAKAMDTLLQFHLVLVMEWLAYATDHTRDVLGFHDMSTMTERVRPHINQAKRDDGQEHNDLGAAGIAKASWKPENYLSKEQYKRMSEDLALDEILTDAARRIYLERIVCDDMKERAN